MLQGRGDEGITVGGPQGQPVGGLQQQFGQAVQAQQQAPQILQNLQQQASQLQGAGLLRAPTAGTGANVREFLDQNIVAKIAQLRQQGIPDSEIRTDLIRKGIDPATYGL